MSDPATQRDNRRHDFTRRAAEYADTPKPFDPSMLPAVLGISADGEGKLPYKLWMTGEGQEFNIGFTREKLRPEVTARLDAVGVKYTMPPVNGAEIISLVRIRREELDKVAPLFDANPARREAAKQAFLQRLTEADRAPQTGVA